MTPLEAFIYDDLKKSAEPELLPIIGELLNRAVNRDGIQAVFLYGSGLWQGYSDDCVWDIQILVERLSDFSSAYWPRMAGRVISPNVFYYEISDNALPSPNIWRIKCNVMTFDQFEKHCKGRSLTPHIWARFAQPCRLLHARSGAEEKRAAGAIANAVRTFHDFALPFAPDSITSSHDIWAAGLRKTYAMELRSEKEGRGNLIIKSAPANFAKRTELWLKETGEDDFPSRKTQKQNRRLTRLKMPLAKCVNFFRLLKSATTFQGGVDYALYKIERHSGVRVEPTEFQRKYPLIGGWPLLWTLWRKGALR